MAVEKKAECSGEFPMCVLTLNFMDAMKEGRPLHLPEAASKLPEQFGLDAVADALAIGGETGATTAQKRGEPYMRGDTVFLAYLDQAGLSLANAERFFPALREACEKLAEEAFDHASARLVLEPPDCEAAPLVADADILAIQLRGEQRLTLARPIAGLPVSAPRPQPLLSATMRPGDALFVPCGLECRASSASRAFAVQSSSAAAAGASDGGPCLVALLSLRSPDQSVAVSLGRYLNDLVREAALSEDTDAFLRSAVIRRTKPSDVDKERMSRVASELAAHVSAKGLREHYQRRIQQLQKEREAAVASTAAATKAWASSPHRTVTSKCRIRASEGVTVRCDEGSNVARFTRGTETLNLPISHTASYLINDLSDGKAKVVGTLRCADEFEKLCVCQILVLKECLELVR